MAKLKPIEGIAEDVREGDLVRLRLSKGNEYTGYFRDFSTAHFFKRGMAVPETEYVFQSTLKGKGYRAFFDLFEKKLFIQNNWRDEGTPLRRSILGYEIIRRAKKR